MKPWQLERKITALSEKLTEFDSSGGIRIDHESFSEAEKQLFRNFGEIFEEYQRTGNYGLIEKNADLIVKGIEVGVRRVTELYCEVVPLLLGFIEEEPKNVEFYFKWHFANFTFDLLKDLTRLRFQSNRNREKSGKS